MSSNVKPCQRISSNVTACHCMSSNAVACYLASLSELAASRFIPCCLVLRAAEENATGELASKRAKRSDNAPVDGDEGLDEEGSVEHHVMITGSLHLVGGALSLLGCDVE
eukprot:TRINITY_DN10411_c0_g1_i6.p1 TRINITY_DN10411_c0_g1~~TRINITY_DN10411_c0_g1_i6.p1  ORF type:complete len:110 (+),score=19.79 TRINITY_DN10411_c0_g1_i6:20-349(+)